MKNKCLYYILPLIITCLTACAQGKSIKPEVSNDTVALAKISLKDTVNYAPNDSINWKIMANVEISYPAQYRDKEKTESLQKLFSGKVLEVTTDSITLASAFPVYVKNLIGRYEGEAAENSEAEADYEPVAECSIEAKVSAVYNKNGIACFEASEISTYDNEYYTYRGYFYTVNLASLKLVDISDIFGEEELMHISDLLKMQLQIDLGAKNEDELVELGFFNIDNVRVNNNFKIGNNGITWNYLPGELSVVEQIEITLDYDILRDYILENSIVSKLID